MSIKDRLQMVMKMNNLTNASFADRVGVQRSSISHVMAGRNKPSLDFIQKTLLAFPRVNAQWLITGKQDSAKKEVTYKDDKELNLSASEACDNDVGTAKEKNVVKQIDRVIVFYNDGTFAETVPNAKKL
jgi:transcriptional regulator with XRE-family HTH domain